MNRLRDSMETLATRGTPRGADQIFSAASAAMAERRSEASAEATREGDTVAGTATTRPRRPWVAFAAAFAAVLVVGLGFVALTRSGEAPNNVGTETIASTAASEREESAGIDELDEILEPHSVLVNSFGDSWVKQDQWEIEASTAVTTGCQAFDELLMIDDWGGAEATWSNGTSRLSQRVADLGFEAQAYLDTARDLPDSCPIIDLGRLVINVSRPALDAGVVYQLSAFPVPDPASGGHIPEFDVESQGWVITMRRANIVSVLTIEANGDLSPSDVENLASIARNALEAAEPEALGPVTRQEGPKPQAPGPVPGTHTLTFDDAECRDIGTVPVDGIEWELLDPVPFEWRDLGPQQGNLTIIDDENAKFVAADGTELRVTIGGREDKCFGWVDDDE